MSTYSLLHSPANYSSNFIRNNRKSSKLISKLNGLTAQSPSIQADEGGIVFHGLCAMLLLLTLSVKDDRKKNKVSAKFRPRQILIGNFLATCTILSYFFDSEQLFGE